MLTFIFVFCTVLVPTYWAVTAAPKGDKFKIAQIFVWSGICFLWLMWFIDGAIPFTGMSLDDRAYYLASLKQFKSFSDWFDMSQFHGIFEQAGYPMMLAWIHQFAVGSVVVRKALNICLFLLVAAIWYSIGKLIGGRRMALVCSVGVLLSTPLWFYWMFLLKDMAIVFFQSLLLLGLVYLLTRGQRTRGYWLVVLATLLIIPFRSALALVNLATLGWASLLRVEIGRPGGRLVINALLVAVVAGGLLVLGEHPEYLAKLGVLGGSRGLDQVSIESTLADRARIREVATWNVPKFALLYLIGETSAFNPGTWRGDPVLLLRGLLVVPWMYFGLPLFVLGAKKGIQRRPAMPSVEAAGVGVRSSQLPDRAYVLLFLGFILIYFVVSWLSGDTTRWRLASFPPMVAIAAIGWVGTRSSQRTTILLIWGAILSLVVMFYYILAK